MELALLRRETSGEGVAAEPPVGDAVGVADGAVDGVDDGVTKVVSVTCPPTPPFDFVGVASTGKGIGVVPLARRVVGVTSRRQFSRQKRGRYTYHTGHVSFN